MTTEKRRLGPLACSLVAAAVLSVTAVSARAEKMPPLWGFGVKSCDQFVKVMEGDADGRGESKRYEDWLTGFISGLNLATGKDVLKGADIESAMRRIRAHCGGNKRDDFFTATMDLVRMLSGLR